MHELGIVFKVIDIVEETARENGAKEVESVMLEIGEVSGVIESYLQKCWSWSIQKRSPALLGRARLLTEMIPAVTYCGECGGSYETVRYGKTCPFCGGSHTWLLQGNEFLIREIAVYEEA